MREINKIAENLFEKIRDRFEDVSLGDEKAKATQDPEKARFFNFDYVVDGSNHGNITISIIDELSLKVYFSKNISKNLVDNERKQWYSFLKELREFAKRNMLSFEPRDITRSTLTHRDIQQVSKSDDTYSKDDVVTESRMYGTMNRSYEDFGPVRIKVAHAKPIMDETHGARARNIEAVFVENDQGERFRMPFNSLIGTRAMARHISAGGTPTDEFGQHICEMVNEMLTLRPFCHSMRQRQFEDASTNEMLESAFGYHALLKNTLKKMKGKKGYNEYKESYKPAIVEDEFDESELRDKFVKKVFPSKLEAALPLVHKAHSIMKEQENNYINQFESWADEVAESWDDSVQESDHGDTPFDQMTVEELADYLNIDERTLADMRSDVAGDFRLHPDDEFEEIDDILGQRLYDAAVEQAQNVAEGDVHGSAMGGMDGVVYNEDEYCDACDRPAKDCVCEEYDEDQVESIATAIIRRILNNIGQHTELLRKAGPDGVLNAARDVASFHAPVEELGTSDISNMVREVYNEVGVPYPEVNEGKMKEVSMDLDDLSDEEFQAKYGKTKEEMKQALAEGLTGLQKFGAGAALVGALAGNAYLDKQSTESSPQLQKLEQLYQQAMASHDTAKANELEDRIENLKARLELGKGEVVDAHGNPVEPKYESVDDIRKLAGL